MNSENIEEIFLKLVQDSVLLQNGKEFLENLLTNRPNFINDSLFLFLESNQTLQTKKYAGILIKNLLKDNWETHPNLISSQQVCIFFNFCLKNLLDGKKHFNKNGG